MQNKIHFNFRVDFDVWIRLQKLENRSAFVNAALREAFNLAPPEQAGYAELRKLTAKPKAKK